MEGLKDSVIQMLRDTADRPITMKEIARRLEIRDEARRKLRTAVRELVETGELVQTRGKRFGVPEHMNLVVGTFLGHPDGYGFVQPLPRAGQVNLPDIFVSGKDLEGAMHGDKVVVRVAGRLSTTRPTMPPVTSRRPAMKRIRGEIIRVLDRAHENIVGYYDQGRRFGFVKPADERIPHNVYVSFADSLDAEPGQVVVAEITEYPSHQRNPEGKVTEILGWSGDRGLDTELLIRRHGLASEFSARALKAAERLPRKISQEELSKRADLRNLPMVTIDGADAKDFDDAVSLEISEKGNPVLGVHIADVSSYVTPGSPIDDEGYERATSIYLEDRVLPMLPERLSNDLCSLRENEDRLAMTVKMEISQKGTVTGYEILESVIRVRHRMTYDEVFAILEGDSELAGEYADFADTLHSMNKLARMLRAKRMKRGSLDFNFPEARAICDSEGEVIDIVLQKHTIAHELIEEFMLMANETVARHITNRRAPMLYRIHEEPDSERMEAFREFIASLGYHLGETESLTPAGLQRVSREAQGTTEESLINYLMLRSLKEARYSPDNAGHFGLACDCYTHFTSPIRRYPDLMVHRILRDLDTGGSDIVEEKYGMQLEKIAEHCSIREREAMEAERESLEIKQHIFIADKVGDEFEGRITGVHSFGLFVQLTAFLAEGLVHVSTLEDDYYGYMEDKHCLIGENAGKTYRLGDLVRVQVVRVDVERRRMDLVLVEEEAAERASPAKKKARGTRKATAKRKAKSSHTRKGRGRRR